MASPLGGLMGGTGIPCDALTYSSRLCEFSSCLVIRELDATPSLIPTYLIIYSFLLLPPTSDLSYFSQTKGEKNQCSKHRTSKVWHHKSFSLNELAFILICINLIINLKNCPIAWYKIELEVNLGNIFRVIAFHFSLKPVISNWHFKVIEKHVRL